MEGRPELHNLCGGICLLSIVSVSRGVPMVDLAEGVNASATPKLSGGICPFSILSVSRGVPIVVLADGVTAISLEKPCRGS